MQSVADSFRRETHERVLRLSIADRIALALSLGDADLDLYIKTSGKTREQAMRDLTAQRAKGRARSRAASRS
jgi:hypothetical protein